MTRLLSLGVRLSWRAGRAGRLRVGLLAVGSAIAAFVVLTCAGLTEMADRQADRAAAIAPFSDEATSGTLRGEVIADGWNDQEMQRVVLASTGSAPPVPPGLERVPSAGEVALSPALSRLADREALIAARFPQHRVAVIADDGLVEPGQLLAYVGVDPSELSPAARNIVGFGDPDARGNLDPRAARTVSLLVLLTLVAPVVMFMVTCARLSATARSQRLAALRLLGLSARRTQVVNAAENGLVGLLGAGVGLAVWTLWREFVPTVEIGSFGWYSTDLRLGPVATALTLAGLVLLTITVGVAGSAQAVARPLQVRRDRSVRRVSLRRAIPLGAGMTLLVISWMTSGRAPASFLTWMLPFGSGLVLTAIGLITVVPGVAKAVGMLLHRSDRPSALLAGARLQHEPAVAGRVLSSMAIALFAAGFSQVVLTAVNTAYQGSSDTEMAKAVNLTVWGPATHASAYSEISDLGVVLPQWQIGSDGLDALAATCDQLRAASASPLPDCRDGHIYQGRSARQPDDDAHPATAIQDALREAGLPPAEGELAVDLLGPDSIYVPSVIVPPDQAPARTSRFNIAFSRGAYDAQAVTAALAHSAPAAFWSPLITAVDRLDSARIYTGIVAVGTTAALAVGLVALVVATVDRSIERRNSLAHLAALGAPSRTIRTALALQTLPVAVVVLVTSGAAAVIGGSSYLHWGDPDTGPPLVALAYLTALGIGAAVAATVAGMAGTVAHPHPELLRQE